MPAIDRARRLIRRSPAVRIVLHILISLGVALFYAFYVWRGWQGLCQDAGRAGAGSGPLQVLAWAVGRPGVRPSLLLLLRNSLLTIFFLSRRPSRDTSWQPWPWLAAVGGTFVGYLFQNTPASGAQSPRVVLANWIMFAGIVLSVAAVASLGRSFGIVPSHRGLRTGGLYRFARHPIYGAYIVLDLGFLLANPTALNLDVYICFILLCYSRAVYEESLLAGDPEYRRYLERVHYRFLPGIL